MNIYKAVFVLSMFGGLKLNAQNLQTVTQNGNTTNRLIQITDQTNVPTTGVGLELYSSNGGDGNIGGYNRGTSQPTNLRISQGGGNTYINQNGGNVGIGTTSPAFKLDVAGATRILASVFTSSNTPFPSSAVLYSQDNYNLFFGVDNQFGSNFFGMKTDGSFLISGSGNVGIGTTAPLTKLHVNGSSTSNLIALNESGDKIGFLSKGASLTSGWSATPDILALTYFSRDFAIGGWGKSDGLWKGASIYITSDNGNVLVGKTSQQNTGYKLDVAGNVRANKIVVNTTGADYVFDSTYELKSLSEVEAFIKINHHLPQIASADSMQTGGLDVGENQTKLLEKIEELTLYILEQNKINTAQQQTIESLKADMEKLKRKGKN